MTSYEEKLKDPRWQKKRLEILNRDKFTCRWCGDDKNTLHVHHTFYENGKDPWDYKDWSMITLCENCHTHDAHHKNREEYVIQPIIRRLNLHSSPTITSVEDLIYVLFEDYPYPVEYLTCVLELWLRNPSLLELMCDSYDCQVRRMNNPE